MAGIFLKAILIRAVLFLHLTGWSFALKGGEVAEHDELPVMFFFFGGGGFGFVST